MTVQTRYFTNTVDADGYPILDTTMTGALFEKTLSTIVYTPNAGLEHIGIKVYIQHADSSLTLISDAEVDVASMACNGDLITTISATWDCPVTAILVTDRVLVEVRYYFTGGIWHYVGYWRTEVLGVTQLDASTWTVYYRMRRAAFSNDDNWNNFYFRVGSDTPHSRIEGFSISTPSAAVEEISGDGLTFATN